MNRIITAIDSGRSSFKNSVKKLAPEIKEGLIQALKDLRADPQPARLRLEKLSGYRRPDIYTIHITTNHSHKASFELDGSIAVMRRVGTHKEIDRTP